MMLRKPLDFMALKKGVIVYLLSVKMGIVRKLEINVNLGAYQELAIQGKLVTTTNFYP